jgi:hypothetical protein
MSMAATMANFDMGRVITRLVGALRNNIVVLSLLSLLLVGIPSAVVTALQLYYVTTPMMLTGSPTDFLNNLFSPIHIAMGVSAALISAAANAVLQAAVIHATVSDLSGRRATFGECLQTGLRFLLPLIAIGIIAAVCEFCGYLLLIVPGVFLALAWCVAAPAAVVERQGVFAAFGRSVELTRDHRFAILGLALLLIVIGWVVSGTVGAAVGIGGAASALVSYRGAAPDMTALLIVQAGVSLITQTFIACVSSAGVASVYYELRFIKEGIGAEQLASLFD